MGLVLVHELCEHRRQGRGRRSHPPTRTRTPTSASQTRTAFVSSMVFLDESSSEINTLLHEHANEMSWTGINMQRSVL